MNLCARLLIPMARLLAGLVLVAGCAGCVVVPISAFTESPFPDTVLQPLLRDHADRNQVEKVLGKPRATKSGGKYWFYTSSREFLGIIGGNSSAVIDDYEWVMLEFDDAGRVALLEYNDDRDGCLSNGICYLTGFLSPQPVISAPAVAAAAVQSYRPRTDECAVYLYLQDLPWYYGDLPVLFSIDGQAYGLTNDKGYLFLTHPAGEIRISAWQNSITLPCTGGDRIYVRAVKALDWSWKTGKDIAPVDPAEGEAAIRGLRLTLPDQGEP